MSGTCMKDTWTKPKGGRIKDGTSGRVGWGRVMGEHRGGPSRNMYKGHMDKAKGGNQGWEAGLGGVGAVVG